MVLGATDSGGPPECSKIQYNCYNTICLPVKHMQTFTEFKQVMTEAFHLGQAFHHL